MDEHEDHNAMPPGLDTYQPKERLLFKYFDGEKMVPADPVVLYKRVMNRAADLDVDMKAANFPGFNKAEEAYESLIAKLRQIFRIKPLEEGGLTPTQCEELLEQFMCYCDWVKKNSPTTLTFAAATSAPTASSSAASPPTSSTSASGSTASASRTDAPTSSPSAPASPPAASPQAWSIGVTSAPETE